VLWIIKRFSWFISFWQLLIYVLVALAVAGVWVVTSYLQDGGKFIIEFTLRQWALLTTNDAGHGGFMLYHFVVLFFGCFPASVFMIHAFFNREKDNRHIADFKLWMSVLFWVVLILFTLVSTKIVHYSSLCYFPMSFLAALSAEHLLDKKWNYTNWMQAGFWLSVIPFVVAPFGLAYFSIHTEVLKKLVSQDPFAVENMDAVIHWTGFEFMPGLLMTGVLLGFLFWMKRGRRNRAIQYLFWGTAIWVQLALFFYVKNIEGYSQRANITFWESKKNDDCYLVTFGYRSYTQYFYGRVKKQENPNYSDENWLLTGKIDKPVYISCKTDAQEALRTTIKDARFLYHENGFYFFERVPR
jgi:hypothetical protein